MDSRTRLPLLLAIVLATSGCYIRGKTGVVRMWGDYNTLDEPAFFVESVSDQAYDAVRMSQHAWSKNDRIGRRVFSRDAAPLRWQRVEIEEVEPARSVMPPPIPPVPQPPISLDQPSAPPPPPTADPTPQPSDFRDDRPEVFPSPMPPMETRPVPSRFDGPTATGNNGIIRSGFEQSIGRQLQQRPHVWQPQRIENQRTIKRPPASWLFSRS